MTKQDEILKALKAIEDGYDWTLHEDGRLYIVVQNPAFEEDNGHNPNLVIEVVDDQKA